MTTICGPRSKKQPRNVQNFYKEATISGDNQNIHDRNTYIQHIPKKDRVSQKKKNKFEDENQQLPNTLPDKPQSDGTYDSSKQSPLPQSCSNIQVRSSSQSTLPLDKMINKISILQVQEPKVVNGCYGHTTVVFKRPIIQGKYYLEFKMLKSNLGDGKAKIKFPPAIRLGICPPQYPKNTPLGQDISVGYKGSNGKFVSNGIEQKGGETIKQGDVIGLCMSFSPPYKYQDKELFWQESQIFILKNGVLQGKWNKIYQCFYCPAFSLFNYASIEVRVGHNSFQRCPQGYNSYLSIFSEPIIYQPLKNTALFGQFKFQEN